MADADTHQFSEMQSQEPGAFDYYSTTTSSANESKRKLSMSDFVSKQSTKRQKQPFSAKQPLQALYEKFGKVEFNVTNKEGNIINGFNASFLLNDIEFVGSGSTKLEAKREAAKSCLSKHGIEYCSTPQMAEQSRSGSMISIPTASISSLVNPPEMLSDAAKIDFASDHINFNDWLSANPSLGQSFDDVNTVQRPLSMPSRLFENLQRIHLLNISFNVEKAMEHPSMVMHEIFPDINKKIIWIETGSTQKFHCKVELHGQEFFGEGLGRRQAKQELAKSILSAVLGIKNFKPSKSVLLNKGRNAIPLTKKHPFAQVRHIDQNANYEFQEIENEDGTKLWHATLRVNDAIYQASDVDKSRAKLKVSKQVCNNYHQTHHEEEVVEKSINTSKNPVQMLYEYYGKVQFIEEHVRENNALKFLAGIEIDGQTFTAEGSSKKIAKEDVAIKVFQDVNNINPSAWKSLGHRKKVNEDHLLKPEMSNSSMKNPVAMISKLHPELECSFVESLGINRQKEFVATITFDKKVFQGIGASKKVAKIDAATKVLEEIYSIKQVDMEMEEKIINPSTKTDIDTDYSDKIVQSVYNKFSQIFPLDISYKVVASVVMAKSENQVMTDCFEVISIGTGTKCIIGDGIDISGQALNDCHAEVIACRGMRQFFFDQLWLAMNGKGSCFEKVNRSPHFQLKTNMHLYLYISTAPCGDGRIYNNTNASSKNKTIGCLRTKIENGQGTIPVPDNVMQTTDGILGGERLLTMSCSDKIMKYVALGVQGALLSLFLKPVYFKGIIIGDQYHYGHLSRALFSRVQELTDIQPYYQILKPEFGRTTIKEGRDLSTATKNSFNWYYGQKTVEVVNGVTGKTMVEAPSRLSKISFHEKFQNLAEAANLMKQMNTYHDAKITAVEYQTMKKVLYKHLQDLGYGKWVSKPSEQDAFV